MKPLVIVVPSLGLGGAERSVIKLINALAPHLGPIHLVCLWEADPRMLRELVFKDKIVVHQLGVRKSTNPMAWLFLWCLLRRIRPGILLGWSTYANLVVLLTSRFLPKCKLVISERNYFPQVYRSGISKMRQRMKITRCLIRWMYPWADLITANSLRNVQFLKHIVGTRPRYSQLPNTLDFDQIDQLSHYLPSVPPPNLEGPRLLALGRLDNQKGFDVLLDAMVLVRNRVTWSLVIVGEGPEREALNRQAKRLGLDGCIHWLGKTENPFPFYRWADMVLVPSRFEGFPNVPLEAMALGKTVICSDCKTGPWELTEGGRFGRLVPVGDPQCLADAILELGQDESTRKALGTSAREHVRLTYDMKVVAVRYLSVLGKLP